MHIDTMLHLDSADRLIVLADETDGGLLIEIGDPDGGACFTMSIRPPTVRALLDGLRVALTKLDQELPDQTNSKEF